MKCLPGMDEVIGYGIYVIPFKSGGISQSLVEGLFLVSFRKVP